MNVEEFAERLQKLDEDMAALVERIHDLTLRARVDLALQELQKESDNNS